MKKIKVDKVILYYMDRVDPDGNLYRFYVYKGMASEIEYFCTEETGNMTIPIGEGKYIEIVPREIVKIPVRGYRKLTGIWNRETESLIESLEDLQDAFKQGHHVCIEVGKLPYSIGLNYLRNLQEMSVTAVDDLMGLKERSREEAFNIIQEWTKEFTEKYGNYYFDGSYYDEIDAFIEEKLRTI